jgi:4a-hydroxytetrahydrobiopterin dehydratase
MSPQPTVLSAEQIRTALESLPGWSSRRGALYTVYRAPSSVAAVDLVYAIGQLANSIDHHPDLDWRYDHVFIRSTTHAAGSKVTSNDVELATRTSALATAAGAEAEPELDRPVEIGVDTADPAAVIEVWRELLQYKKGDDDDLTDPWGRGPAVWFQRTESPDASRMHLDVWVEDDAADDVLAATEGRGARRVDDRFRPSFTVIADADGNRFCVCTTLDRS